MSVSKPPEITRNYNITHDLGRFGIIPSMTAEEAPRKFPRVLLEVLAALALLGLGLFGLSMALQQRPYLGNPASALAQVPMRVLAEPNIPIIALFLASLAATIMGTSWFILRFIHQLFFRPVLSRRVWREAIFGAVFVIGLAWLQLNEAFSLIFAAAFFVALILLEVFLNIRERDE
jgi:hypothetical protein